MVPFCPIRMSNELITISHRNYVSSIDSYSNGIVAVLCFSNLSAEDFLRILLNLPLLLSLHTVAFESKDLNSQRERFTGLLNALLAHSFSYLILLTRWRKIVKMIPLMIINFTLFANYTLQSHATYHTYRTDW